MIKKVLTFIGGIVIIPLAFSCASNSEGVLLKRAMAERAVSAAKDAMAEFSKCSNASKDYFDADRNFKQGLGYMSNRSNWETAEPHFDKAIKLAEQAEEEAALCVNK